MKKTNFLKAVVCGITIMMVMTSTVYAGTVSRSKYVRNVNTYTDSYIGGVGNYCGAGGTNAVRLSVQNTTNGDKWYSCYLYRYNHSTQKYDDQKLSSKTVSNGGTMEIELSRNKTSKIYNYIHIAKGYGSSVYSSATLVDDYRLEAKQYYE